MRISLEVDLFKRDLPIGRAMTKDISLGGMMLLSESEEPALNRNDLIAIRVLIDGEEVIMRGLVIHANDKFTGVMLIEMNKEVLRTLFDYLKEMRGPLKAALNSN
jgi:c-di-GMP-binding flagellar brake protein YcgR